MLVSLLSLSLSASTFASLINQSSSGPPVATKSCDDLHRVSSAVHPPSSRSEGCLLTLLLTPSLLLTPRGTASPHGAPKYRLWRGFSRSARDVSVAPPYGPRPAVSLAVMEKLTPRSARPVRHKASTLPYSAAGPQPMGRRHHRGFVALLRRIGPRLRRTPSPDRPWFKVEPRPADRSSVASDHSFETALQVRYPEAAVSSRLHNSAGLEKSGSRGGLGGLLTSLCTAKHGRHDKNASSNSVAHDRDHADGGGDGGRQREGDAPSPPHAQATPPSVPATTVPSLHLHPAQLDTRPKADMITTVVPLHTSTRPTATAQRPHTLNLPNRGLCRAGWTAATGPPPNPPPPPPLPLPPQMSLQTQTTSVDSIGSCSLDVNATGTTSPATMEAVDGSRQSLRSVSLENNLSEVTNAVESVATTPLRPILKPQPFTDPGSRDFNETTDVNHKAPSYLGISCAVNGYCRLNRYDSSLRDGFRSRDASPARLAFSRSRDSSPMRPEWKVFDPRSKASPQATAAKIRELKEELARFKAEFPHPPGERGRQSISKKPGRRPSQGRSISVDRGYLVKSGSRETMNGHENDEPTQGAHRVRLVEISTSDSSTVKSSSYHYSFEQSVVRDGISETSDSVHYTAHSNGDTPETKSFIQSRIERLYGPSALAAGFRSRRSLLELEKEQKDRESGVYKSPMLALHTDSHFEPEAKAPEGFPSVFRHLRPEFRTQLQVKRNNRLRPGISLELPTLDISSQVESPKRPGRVIPITLTGTYEKDPQKPPIPQCKPDVPIGNRGNKGISKNSKPVVVHKIVNDNTNEKETETNLGKEPSINGIAINDEISVTKLQDSKERTSDTIGISDSVNINKTKTSEEKDGHYFLKVVEDVVKSIEVKVAEIESDLKASGSEMSEEVRGKVLAAKGKALLLVSQKIQQFQGLCHKNIAGTADEEFPTTCEDLAGFWDMVSIQVEDIKNNLQEIALLRANGWKEVSQVDTIDGTDKSSRRKPVSRPLRPPKSVKNKTEKTEEGKIRDEARKKKMEERRKAMKEAMRAKRAEAEARKAEQDGEDSVEIYIPESK